MTGHNVRLRAFPQILRLGLFLVLATATLRPCLGQPLASNSIGLSDVVRMAVEQRSEITAARARIRASAERPSIVSALEDPMVAASVDHLPFEMSGMDYSVTVEQRFPLGSIRRNRRQSALAEVERLQAEAADRQLGVAVEAASAFLMLQQRRRFGELLVDRLRIARAIAEAANARYAAGLGIQADVLRAELEMARVSSQLDASEGRIRAAEAMLNASIGRDVAQAVPGLRPPMLDRPVPGWTEIQDALPSLPRLAAGRAEVARSQAEVRVMNSMYSPMVTVRTGPSYTMDEGYGVMAMVGVSIPLWRSRLRAGVREAEAMRQMSEADLLAMTRMAEGEAAQALNELQASSTLQESLRREIVPRARMTLDAALAAYASGRQPLASALEALNAVWSVENELVQSDMEVGLAWIRLGRAIGDYELITL